MLIGIYNTQGEIVALLTLNEFLQGA